MDVKSLADLRNDLVAKLVDADEQIKILQGQTIDWRRKIAAIDTLTDSDETENYSNEPEMEDGDFTPVKAYWRPLLETLIEMGGRGRPTAVIKRVGEKMENVLKAADYGKLPGTGWIRWRNRVMWQRNDMRNQGLLKDDSPRGVWEISDAGRKWLIEVKLI